MTQDAGLFDARRSDIPARLAAPRARAARRLAGRPVPDLGGPRRRQDPPRARARQATARPARGQPDRGPLPDDAADAPVGERGGGARRATGARRRGSASAARLPRRGRHLRARGERPARLGRAGRAGHARGPRRGPPPRRGPRLGHGLSAGVRCRAAAAVAVGDPVSLRRHADPGRALRRRAPGDPRRLLHLRRGGRRRDLPSGDVRHVRRQPVLAQRR